MYLSFKNAFNLNQLDIKVVFQSILRALKKL